VNISLNSINKLISVLVKCCVSVSNWILKHYLRELRLEIVNAGLPDFCEVRVLAEAFSFRWKFTFIRATVGLNCRLLTVEAQVLSHGSSSEICGDKIALGQVFLKILRFSFDHIHSSCHVGHGRCVSQLSHFVNELDSHNRKKKSTFAQI
jgi:hypothetical protein